MKVYILRRDDVDSQHPKSAHATEELAEQARREAEASEDANYYVDELEVQGLDEAESQLSPLQEFDAACIHVLKALERVYEASNAIGFRIARKGDLESKDFNADVDLIERKMRDLIRNAHGRAGGR